MGQGRGDHNQLRHVRHVSTCYDPFPMLFRQRFWPGIRSGAITVTFRAWRDARVVAGHSYRTPAGMLAVTAVEPVERGTITAAHASLAGYGSRDALIADLAPGDDRTVFRIDFRRLHGDDPRDALAARAVFPGDEYEELARRLARMDASASGPWTRAVLETIERKPGVRAADLARGFGRETADFKRDVRKLKELGLTLSLEVGYELAPRGRAYLVRTRSAH